MSPDVAHSPSGDATSRTLHWRPILWSWPLYAITALSFGGLLAIFLQYGLDADRYVGGTLAWRLLDPSEEISVATWFSSLLLLGVAIAALLARTVEPEASLRRGWLILAAIFGAASLEEIATIHEHFGGVMGSAIGVSRWFWVIPGALVGIALAIPLFRLARRLAPDAGRWLRIGILVYAFGALGLESLSGYVFEALTDGSALFSLVGVAEEAGEMTGAAFGLRAVVRHFETHGIELRLAAPRGL